MRPFIYPVEVLLSEQFAYGHREIYVNQLGLPKDTLFLAEIQHGWARDWNDLHQRAPKSRIKKRNFRSYPLLVWSEQIASEFREASMKSVFAIKSPWALIIEAKEEESKEIQSTTVLEQKNSALYFPSHSYPGYDVNLYKETEKPNFVEKGFENITTCLYWLDFINPITRRYFTDFSKVECAGFRSSSAQEWPWHNNGGRVNFLFELYDLISAHEYVFCDEISTACMAALTLDKKVILLKEQTELSSYKSDGKPTKSVIDNSAYLSRHLVDIEKSELGYELHKHPKIRNQALEGFGFDITIESTCDILSRIATSRPRLQYL